jgi:phytoene dehydrogenase-like protein
MGAGNQRGAGTVSSPIRAPGFPAGIGATDWAEATAPFADRVLAKLERFAPGVTERVVGRYAMSPADLEAHNANLLGGDSLGGSVHLRQNLAFRPFPGWTRYEMPVEGLYLCGAATWPGPGNNGTSGWLLAEQLTSGVPWGAVAAGTAAAGAAGAALWALLAGDDA